MLGGLGGIVYITAGVSVWKFENGVAGFGFLALAVMIFGAWHPLKIALAALLFGFCRALGNVYAGFDFLMALNIPSLTFSDVGRVALPSSVARRIPRAVPVMTLMRIPPVAPREMAGPVPAAVFFGLLLIVSCFGVAVNRQWL